jgi:hypothetical protein
MNLKVNKQLFCSLPLCINTAILAVASFVSTSISWQTREFALSEITWSTNQYGLGCDPSRFLLQANWLSEGFGFREATPSGRLCTSLPPGHPLALSLLFHLTENLDALRLVQALTPFLSGILIFFSLRHYGWIRYAASFLVASSPWLTALSSCHMSETTSTFLVALMAFLISHSLRDTNSTPNTISTHIDSHLDAPRRAIWLNNLTAIFVGTTASVTILTAPGLIFSMLTLIALFAYRSRNNWHLLICTTIGLSLPLAIWQIHCLYAEGRPVLSLLTPLDPSMNDEKAWVRTWARTPKETVEGYRNFAWNVDQDFTDVPEYAFQSESEKNEIIQAYLEVIDPAISPEVAEEAEKARVSILSNAIRNRRHQRPFEVWITLPIQRGLLSWLEQQPVSYHGHDSPENIHTLAPWNLFKDANQRGIYRATLRASRGLYGLFVIISHYGTIMLVGFVVLKGFRCSLFATSLILGSLLIYTYLHGLDGPECRRNLPFLPLLFCLPAIATNLMPTSQKTISKQTS